MPSLNKSVVSRPMRRQETKEQRTQEEIRRFYRTLDSAWGPQNWWPAESPLEMIVGAFLTQNTAWTNVEKALRNLRAANALSLYALRSIALLDLELLIRPAGYFRQKSARLKLFVQFLDDRYDGSLDRMFAAPTEQLRAELLALNGVGPETADSILLYAGNHVVFVVDAYTRRIVERHGILPADSHYEDVREFFEKALTQLVDAPVPASKHSVGAKLERRPTHSPSGLSTALRSPSAQLFNEMHALIVEVGKHYCRKSEPLCSQCPLGQFLGTPE
jgi:endonuclease-3 related protein